MILKLAEFAGKLGQFMVMGGEQAPAAAFFMQIFHHRPGNREAVKRRRATPDFIQDHQRTRPGLMQDGGGFHHFHHERAAATRQIVGGADAAEQAIHHADMRPPGRHEAAHLRQHRDQCILAQEGAFTGHVGAGEQPEFAAIAKIAVIGDKSLALAAPLQGRFHHRMTAGDNLKIQRDIHQRPHPAPLHSQFRQRRRHIQRRQRFSGLGDTCRLGQSPRRQRLEHLQFQRQGAITGLRDAAFQFTQFRRGIAHRIGHGLAMDEAWPHTIRMARRDLDVVAEHVIMPDLEAGNAGLVGITLLQGGDMAPAFIAQQAQFIQIGAIAGSHKAAIAGIHRQFGAERRAQGIHQHAMEP